MNKSHLLNAVCTTVLAFTAISANASLITFIDDQAGWESKIGGIGSVTGTEDFNSFTTDVSAHDTTINLSLFSITASSGNPAFNIIDAHPFMSAQSDQDGTTSYLGYQNVTIDFNQDLAALSFGYLDEGNPLSQSYDLQVNFVSGGSSVFSLGNPFPEIFIGVVADGGTLIDSITWLLPPSPSPFSVDNFSLVTSPVPVPAAVWLFGSGLLGLIGLARRKA